MHKSSRWYFDLLLFNRDQEERTSSLSNIDAEGDNFGNIQDHSLEVHLKAAYFRRDFYRGAIFLPMFSLHMILLTSGSKKYIVLHIQLHEFLLKVINL